MVERQKKPRTLVERLARRGLIARWVSFVTRDIWYVEVRKQSWLRGFFTRVVRIVLISGRGFERDRCMQKAQALTYMTIFSLPAFLALVFSIAKGFKAYKRLKEGPIDSFLDSAFPQSEGEGAMKIRELVDQIFAYVDRADLSVLTTVGILFVLYATIKMLSGIEAVFNEIWGVQRARTLIRKFADYLAIVLVTPLILLVGTTFTAFIQTGGKIGSFEIHPLPVVGKALLTAIPVVSIWVGMSLILLTLPNTRVKLSAALVGGLFAGVAWQIAQVLFFSFQGGLVRLNAIFASFAAVPMLLTWIYFSWVALFLGAELSAAFQNEALFTSIARTGKIDQRLRELLAPRLAGRIAHAFVHGLAPPTAPQLATELGVAPRAVMQVLEALERHRLIAQTAEEDEEGYLPARDPDTITVLDLLHALRRERGVNPIGAVNKLDERVDRIMKGFDDELGKSLHNYTLRELARTLTEESDAPDMSGQAEARPAEHPSA